MCAWWMFLPRRACCHCPASRGKEETTKQAAAFLFLFSDHEQNKTIKHPAIYDSETAVPFILLCCVRELSLFSTMLCEGALFLFYYVV